MSFLAPYGREDLPVAAANAPAWEAAIGREVGPGLATPGVPMVNAGPWGRGYHGWLERVHAPYAFGVLPELVRGIARGVLREEAEDVRRAGV